MTDRIFILVALVLPLSTQAQLIDNTALYRSMESFSYLRVHYENDFFSKADIYYTQGINLEFVDPLLQKNPLSKLLIYSAKRNARYGLSAEHLGFTPTSIAHPEILQGDRPFASCLFLKAFSMLNDTSRNDRVTSAVSIGVFGPAAGGRQFQEAIHKWIGDEVPLGWEHQIRNDVILNYQIAFDKRLFEHRFFMAAFKGDVRVGTWQDQIGAGLIFMSGLFKDPFQNFANETNAPAVYVYVEPQLTFVAYDATLQGGLFNKHSPYVLPSSQISRIVFKNHAGVVIKIKKLWLEYFQSFVTKEFKNGRSHQWGGIRIGVNF